MDTKSCEILKPKLKLYFSYNNRLKNHTCTSVLGYMLVDHTMS